jgi:GR25 family glycosyltransferase involved in LPS biosynthesis
MNNIKLQNIEKIFIINLKRRPDRLEHFLKKKEYLPEFEIFEAIDGQQLKLDNTNNLLYFDNKILENHLIKKIKGLKVGEIGCFLSHYFIWKKIIELNKSCLIFEDDANPCNDFSNKLNNILEKGTPDNFDILWIGIRQHHVQNKIYNENILPNKNKLVNQHFYHYINTKNNPFYPYCYIISPNACKFLCNLFENTNKYFPAVDHFICSNLENNYICINNSSPIFLCYANQGDTDIQTFNNNIKNNKFL